MQGMLAFFAKTPDYTKAQWHFLFHSNIVTAELHAAFLQLKSLSKTDCLHFYTDTEQLTAQYNQLGVLPFSTLPIPIELGFAKTEKQGASLYCVSYIGDARAEKGYQHLPSMVEKLLANAALKDKLKFVFQSNFNIEEGEPAAIIARAELEKWPEAKVKLLKNPLNPTEYRSLLMLSDIVVFPYDSNAYAARSSGIFTEAMTAGIPVVVPAGSWMAIQLQESIAAFKAQHAETKGPQSVVGVVYEQGGSLADSIAEIVSHYDHYRTSALDFSKQWMAYHNPQKLLECLV
jgi:glycosyltransferase involved in cell wall biosynthesis